MNNRIEISLTGPDFIASATNLGKNLRGKFVWVATIYDVTESAALSQLQTALSQLRIHFTPFTVITLLSSYPLPADVLSALASAAGFPVRSKVLPLIFVKSSFMMQQEMINARHATTPQVSQESRWKKLIEVQNRISQIQQDLEKSKIPSKTNPKTTFIEPPDGYIRK